MLCVPMLNVEIEYVATLLPFKVEVASLVVPSKKLTDPVGVPDVLGLTVAVKVTD